MSRAQLLGEYGDDPLLTPAEVGRLFRVDPKTVARWAAAGRLPCIKTLGGHRRYRQSEMMAIREGDRTDDQSEAG